MKTKGFIIITITALILALAGCQEANHEAIGGEASLRLHLTSPRFSHRALIPSTEALTIDHFDIVAHGPQEKSVELTSHEEEVVLGNLLIGWWTIEATAYNKSGVALVSGSVKTLLSTKTTTANLELSDLVGSGTLSLSATWDPDQVADDVALSVTLLDQEMHTVALDAPVLQTAEGTTTISKELPAGSYILTLSLSSQGVVVSGATVALRIIDGVTSSDTLELVIGDLSTEYTVTVTNKTGLPIQGSVECTPKEPKAGDEVTMVYTPTNLPEGVKSEDLSIHWYCEGEFVQEESDTYVSIPSAGTHRYDVIVNHPTLGSLGSTSILFVMPLGGEGGE